MTVRVQPDGYILELGRDGEDCPIATMACRTHDAGTELAESICANMRDKYWWRVFPVIFGSPTPPIVAPALSERSASRDLAAPADSPGPAPPHSEPVVKFDPDTGQRKSTPLRGPGDGACLNCGERVSEPITVTDGQQILQVAWCAFCGAHHTRDDDGWSVAVPLEAARCPYCECPQSACACGETPERAAKGE